MSNCYYCGIPVPSEELLCDDCKHKKSKPMTKTLKTLGLALIGFIIGVLVFFGAIAFCMITLGLAMLLIGMFLSLNISLGYLFGLSVIGGIIGIIYFVKRFK